MAIITSSWQTDLLTLLAGVLTIAYLYLKYTYNYWKNKKVSYEEPNLLFGNFYDALAFKKNVPSYFGDLYKKTTEKLFGFYIFQRPYLLVRDPELIKHVLVKDFNNFVDRSNADIKTDEIGRHNLFSIKSAHGWRFIRSKLTPFFSSGKMKNIFGLLDAIGDQLTEHIKTHVNETIEMKDICRKYTTDVIVSAAYGLQANSLSNEKSEFSSVGKHIFTYTWRRSIEIVCIFFVPTLAKLFNFKLFSETASQFLRAVISKAINDRELSNIKRPDLIDALIALKNTGTLEDTPVSNGFQKDIVSNGKVFQDDKSDIKLEGDVLVAQAAVFFTGGFESTSSSISFTLYSIAYRPEVQIKLRKEIQTVIAANGGKFTYECLAEMKYLDLCIKETTRLYPTLGYLDREALNTYIFPGTDITVDAGTPIIISTLGLHMDPQYFENPEVYDPERYNDENKSKIQAFTYLPFGEGQRNCIGARFGLMSTKVGLVHILKDYEVVTFKTAPHEHAPLAELDNRGFLITAKSGILLKFIPGTVYTK